MTNPPGKKNISKADLASAFRALDSINNPDRPLIVKGNDVSGEKIIKAVKNTMVQKKTGFPETVPQKDMEAYNAALVMFMRGVPSSEISRITDIANATIKNWASKEDWDGMRLEIRKTIREEIVKKTLNTERRRVERMVDIIDPLLSDLCEKALEHSQDRDGITGKDYIKYALDAIRLKAQLSGEITEKKELSVGPNDAFRAIMDMNAAGVTPPEGIDPLLLEAPKLIE